MGTLMMAFNCGRWLFTSTQQKVSKTMKLDMSVGRSNIAGMFIFSSEAKGLRIECPRRCLRPDIGAESAAPRSSDDGYWTRTDAIDPSSLELLVFSKHGQNGRSNGTTGRQRVSQTIPTLVRFPICLPAIICANMMDRYVVRATYQPQTASASAGVPVTHRQTLLPS